MKCTVHYIHVYYVNTYVYVALSTLLLSRFRLQRSQNFFFTPACACAWENRCMVFQIIMVRLFTNYDCEWHLVWTLLSFMENCHLCLTDENPASVVEPVNLNTSVYETGANTIRRVTNPKSRYLLSSPVLFEQTYPSSRGSLTFNFMY